MVEKARAGISLRAGNTVFGAGDPASVDRFVRKDCRGGAGCSRAGSDEFGKIIYPHQFIECAAQPNQEVDIRSQLSVPGLRASRSHPPEDVRSSAELLNRTMSGYVTPR